jgi:CheY-like chemotaxis protein
MDSLPDLPPSSAPHSLESYELAHLVSELLDGTEDHVRGPLCDLVEKVEGLTRIDLSGPGRDAAGQVLSESRALLATVDAWLDELLAAGGGGELGLAPSVDCGEPTTRRPAGAARESLGQARVLVIDEDPVARHVTLGFLASEGYWALAAESFKQARELLGCEEFDALLFDPLAPTMDSRRFVSEFCAGQAGARMKIVALTHEVGPQARRRCSELGVDSSLSRPVRSGELDLLLSALLVN